MQEFAHRDPTRPVHLGGRVVVPPSLIASLQRGLGAPTGGEVVVTAPGRSARLFLTRGAVAWVVSDGVSHRLSHLLETTAGIPRELLRPVVTECRANGSNFGETLLRRQLVDRATLRCALLRHNAQHFLGLLAFAPDARTSFEPRPRDYRSELLFEVGELLEETARLVGSVSPPAPIEALAPLAAQIPQCQAMWLLDLQSQHVCASWPTRLDDPSTSLVVGRSVAELLGGPIGDRIGSAMAGWIAEGPTPLDTWLMIADDVVGVVTRCPNRPSRGLVVLASAGANLGLAIARTRAVAAEVI